MIIKILDSLWGIKKTDQSKVRPVLLVKVNPQENQHSKPDSSVEDVIEAKEKIEKEEEDKKKKEKEEFDSRVAALNYLASFCLFLIILGCDIAFWITIGN